MKFPIRSVVQPIFSNQPLAQETPLRVSKATIFMAKKTWKVTDVANQIFTDSLNISPDDFGGTDCEIEIQKSTLRGGQSEGVEVITVKTGGLSYSVLPTRGMGLWKAWSGTTEFGWNSPTRGPVHPAYVPLMEPSGLGWLDGFDELLVRCGLESNGAPEFDDNGVLKYPLHGRIANKPAEEVTIEVDSDNGEVTLTGVVYETRFHFLKLKLTSSIKTKVGSSKISITDTITNLSDNPAEYQLLYHTNFGDQILDEGSRFEAPVKAVVPRNDHSASNIENWQTYPAPQAGTEEQVYFMELLGDQAGQTKTLLKNSSGNLGVSLECNVKQLPVYTLWKNPTSVKEGYVTGLEPAINFPNPRSYEGKQNRVGKLEAGQSDTIELALELLTESAAVDAVDADIQKLQAGVEPQVFDSPQKDWCADA